MSSFAALGVDVQLTEVDVTNASTSQYQGLTAACLNVPRCAGITVWGIRDTTSWRASESPLLFDGNGTKKAAYTSVLNALNSPGTTYSGDGTTPTGTATPTESTTPTSSATPTDPSGSGACAVTYTVTSQWQGGFGATVNVTNRGAAVSSWRVGWTFGAGQKVDTLWNGTVSQSGSQVTVTNASYNGNLGSGQSTSFGFNGSWSGSNPVPTAFTFNGASCNGDNSTPPPSTTPPTPAHPPRR